MDEQRNWLDDILWDEKVNDKGSQWNLHVVKISPTTNSHEIALLTTLNKHRFLLDLKTQAKFFSLAVVQVKELKEIKYFNGKNIVTIQKSTETKSGTLSI